MRLTIFNGSPRGTKSNSKLLMEHFLNGFSSLEENSAETIFLNRVKETEKNVKAFQNAEHAIMIFPLYTDAMPGIVKHFIEALMPLCGSEGNPTLGFIIQSGFPEPAHSRYVARYMEKTARRIGCPHTGTVVRGGVEGIQIQPPWMTKKLFRLFVDLGKAYGETGKFDEGVIHKLAPRESLSAGTRLFFRIGKKVGFTNMYWNMMLKKNNAYDKRFARPFSADQ